MKKLVKESIDSWLNVANKRLHKKNSHWDSGWYELEDLPLQTHFGVLSVSYAGLGRAQYLNGQPITCVREAFSLSGKNMLQVFTMAYDLDDLF